jgi:hypothetical protein
MKRILLMTVVTLATTAMAQKAPAFETSAKD